MFSIRNFLRREKESKNLAKSRLQFVLVQDRAGLSNEDLARFKREMMDVIQRYFVIDETGFDVNYQRENDSTTLLINSPIVVRRESITHSGANSSEAAGGLS